MLATLGGISHIISQIITPLRHLMPRIIRRLKTNSLSRKTIYPLLKILGLWLPLTILGGFSANDLGITTIFQGEVRSKDAALSANQIEAPTTSDTSLQRNFLEKDLILPPLKMAWQPGLTILHQTVTLNQQGQEVSFQVMGILIDPQNSQIRLRPLLANENQVTGAAPLHVMAQKSGAVAAINAGFFNRQRQMPVGAIRHDGQWRGGVVLHRGAVAWHDPQVTSQSNSQTNPQASELSNQPQFFFDRLKGIETLQNGSQTWQLMPSNSGYVQPGLARYTPAWGRNYFPITENELIFTVTEEQTNGDNGQSNGVIGSYTKTIKVNERPIPIPQNGYLLVVRSFNNPKQNELINTLPLRSPVSVNLSLTPPEFNPYPQIIGAGPLLLKNGAVVLNPKAESFTAGFDRQGADRSVIAKLQDGQILLAVVQDLPDGIAPDLHQTAAVLQQLGAVDALNLDGGSSTTLYAKGSILNRSLANVAPVHSAIGIWIVP